jgi:hypothetical protein
MAAVGVTTDCALADEQPYCQVIEFDVPGAGTTLPYAGTYPMANNDEGTVVGYFFDTNGVPRSFLRTPDGRITPFGAPGAGLGIGVEQGTGAYGINDLGVIVGSFETAENIYYSFLRRPDGSF